MDLNNRLKELNDLPVDQQMKKAMYSKIAKGPNQFAVWKEFVLLGAIAVISFILMFLPSINPPHEQANSQSVEAIYSYENGKEGKFYARPSTLYLGVEKIDEAQLYEFFEHYQDYVKPSSRKLDTRSPIDVVVKRDGIDVVVVKDGAEEKWKLFWSGILNVDTGDFYKAINRDDYGEMIATTFFNGQSNLNYPIFFVLLLFVLLTNLIPRIIYKKRGEDKRDPLQNSLPFWIFLIVLYMSFVLWQYQVGPIYKPLLIPTGIIFMIAVHFLLKRYSVSPFVYRFELIRNSISILILITLIYNF